MKKFLSVLLVLCMVISMSSVVSMGESNTVNAVRTAYFNSQSEWALYDTASGSDNVLVASSGSDNWQAESSFTDLNGTVTNQTSLSGSGFLTPRNALVSFAIPEDFDCDNTVNVTLSLTIKNVKQVTSGARLAVYGNSIGGVWSSASDKTFFGADDSDSGLANLDCLGLTTPINTGNQSGETASGETVALSSRALTDYVCKMADEGKSEVTFRIASPLGGIRIYSYNSSYPPTLSYETGNVGKVKVNHHYYNGDELVWAETDYLDHEVLDSEFIYDTSLLKLVEKEGVYYIFSESKSSLSTTASLYGGEVTVVYETFDVEEHSFNGYEFDDEGAWCWFADPRAVVLKNDEGTIDVTVIGYIDVHGNIKATQINNLTNKVDEVLIRTNIQPDDHNNPTFIMIPDGRIVVFYSRHTDEACFWYRVTEEPGDLTTLGEEKCLVTANNTTYPSPFYLSDDPDHIYLCWRGIEWHPTIAKLSLPDENGDMEFTFGPYQMVRSSNVGDNVRPYAKYASNGKDKIYMSYTGTHPDNYNPNWLYFNYIDINTMTMHDINGTLMRTIENGPLIVDHSNQSHIVDKTSSVRNWLWQVAVADDGYPVIANVRINSGKSSHDYYYVKWNGTEWVKTFMTNAGGKFHPSSTEYCYSGGMSIDADNPNVVYCSKPVEGVFGNVWEIFKYTMSADGSEVLSVEQITQNSIKNNVRPWVIPGSEGDELRVIWMNGDYYYWMVNSKYPAGYPTAAMSEVPLPTEEVDLYDRYLIADEDYSSIGGVFISEKTTANYVAEDVYFDKGTASADVYLSGDYTGKIMDLGDIKVSVKNLDTRYADNDTALRPRLVLTVNGVDYPSPNVYGTSDDWKNHNVQTGGEYYFTKYDRYVNLTVVNDGEYITVYRDGLVDIKEKIESVSISRFAVGGFDGYAENALLSARVLNHDEISALADEEYIVQTPSVSPSYTIDIVYEDRLGNLIKPVEEVDVYPGTDVYEFVPENSFIYNDTYYTLVSSNYKSASREAVCVYEKNHTTGDNLVTDGSFEDEDGNFSWGTWQTPKTEDDYNNGYFNEICQDWFYKVDRDTNASVLYTKELAADDYALGTRWNDGVAGLCSMANFIEVKGGKTYVVSYDYKNKTAGASSETIRTTFQKTKDFTPDDSSDNNIPLTVTTNWQTNKFTITAPEDGYIYFHFYWLGSGNNTNTSSNVGSGPYWYFDNFSVYELEPEAVTAKIIYVSDEETTVKITNVTDSDIDNIMVYAASYSDEGEVENVECMNVEIKANKYFAPVFNVGGNVKVFIWDKNMKPMCDMLTN